jgi:hypothetical protein
MADRRSGFAGVGASKDQWIDLDQGAVIGSGSNPMTMFRLRRKGFRDRPRELT